jgi:hypothetical protein
MICPVTAVQIGAGRETVGADRVTGAAGGAVGLPVGLPIGLATTALARCAASR